MDSQTKRKPNWNADETLALTNLVDENKQILRGKLGPSLTSEMKSRTWRNIAVSLTAMGVGPGRTAAEVEKKWHNIFSKSKSEISDHRRATTGTGLLLRTKLSLFSKFKFAYKLHDTMIHIYFVSVMTIEGYNVGLYLYII